MSLDPEELGKLIADEIAKALGPAIDRVLKLERDAATIRPAEAIGKAAKSRKILTPAERAAIFGLRYP